MQKKEGNVCVRVCAREEAAEHTLSKHLKNKNQLQIPAILVCRGCINNWVGDQRNVLERDEKREGKKCVGDVLAEQRRMQRAKKVSEQVSRCAKKGQQKQNEEMTGETIG